MKKIVLLISVVCLVAGCDRPGKSSRAVGLPNPVRECSAQEVLEKTGFKFNIPQGGEDVHYSVIGGTLAQMNFVWSGCDCIARAKATGSVELEDISGYYYNWEKITEETVGWCKAQAKYLTTEMGNVIAVCNWIDVVPGVVYSFSMDIPGLGPGDIDDIRRLCLKLSNETWIPLQGDVE